MIVPNVLDAGDMLFRVFVVLVQTSIYVFGFRLVFALSETWPVNLSVLVFSCLLISTLLLVSSWYKVVLLLVTSG